MPQIHTRLNPVHRNIYAAFAADEGVDSLLSAAQAVLEGEPHSRVLAFYGSRELAQFPQIERMQELKNRYLQRLSLHCFFSEEPQEIEIFNGRLDAGKVARLAEGVFDPRAVNDCYLFGPGEWSLSIAEALKTLGLDGAHIHGQIPTAQPGPLPQGDRGEEKKAAAARADVTEVTVLMDGRRRNFTMALNGRETVLDAAGRCGLELPFSCRAGVCATCRTRLVKGAVDMAESGALESWELEQGYILACQSRPTTPQIELDYDDK